MTGPPNSSSSHDDFLAMLAHELRNPLTAIKFSISGLRKQTGLPDQAETLIRILSQQTDHLAKLVQSLLASAQLSSGKLVLGNELLELNQLVEEATRTVQPLLEGRQQQLNLQLESSPIQVFGDRTWLLQAVMNMMDNAAKFTPESGRIWVEVRTSGEAAEILIRDSGCGMNEATLGRVFERFFQAQNPQPVPTQGFGLGLFLVHQIAAAHSGTISVTSPGVNCGSTFTLQLPLAAK